MSKGSQRYEIYVNNKPLTLLSDEDFKDLITPSNVLALPYSGQSKTLFQYLDVLENSNRFEQIFLYAKEAKEIFNDIKKILPLIEASGGVIENAEKKVLMIFRRSFWDLPKGKLDKGESFEEACLRECIEETGLKELSMNKKLCVTYHFFRDRKNERALKKTKWYHIHSKFDQELKLQTEEDIELAEWMDPTLAIRLQPIYRNIVDVLTNFNEAEKK
ncbi:MAG: NUDIX domain-containing protein [Saprospiraceae bacterium]|nr:NUDIX domain-containing protein [Saprospiraceae bacterium]